MSNLSIFLKWLEAEYLTDVNMIITAIILSALMLIPDVHRRLTAKKKPN